MSQRRLPLLQPIYRSSIRNIVLFYIYYKSRNKKVNHNSSLVKSLEKNQETAGLNPFAFSVRKGDLVFTF
mgnify:CR=1 FL=1